MNKKRINLNEVSEGSEHIINNIDETKMTQILFKCTETQKSNIKKRSQSRGLTVSGYIKFLISEDGGLN
tara:strand:- start:51 stop:257 length:207 start_codon:yes stop_codon:yes gene_type:complete